MPEILVPLAQGFEETEAVTIIDLLRRAGVSVITAGVETQIVTGSHNIAIICDTTLDKIDIKKLDGVVLPGGMPGAKNLLKSTVLRDIILELDREEFLVAAICAAPIVLEAAGILTGKRVTSYPGYEKEVQSGKYSSDEVVVDGNIITSRGVGTAIAFSLELVKRLCGQEKFILLKKAILVV